MKFDWKSEQTKDDLTPDPQASGGRSRRWPFLLLLFALLLLAGYVTWQQLKQATAVAVSNLEGDVLSSHKLALQAYLQQDEELIIPLLSGRDPGWVRWQQRLFEDDLLFAGAARPFGLQVQAGESRVLEVEFSPDLRTATLTAQHVYTVTVAAAEAKVVRLEQPLVYRQGAQRWLLSPPDEDFWGPWGTAEGRRVTLSYPRRDAQVALRLLPFLDQKVEEMCAQIGLCRERFQLKVRLESAPESVLNMEVRPWDVGTGARLILPTPSLVGRPSDREAERVLFQGYARQVVRAANAQMLGYACCDQRL